MTTVVVGGDGKLMMEKAKPVIVLLCFFFFFCPSSSQTPTKLPPSEVEALRQIGTILGKTDWNFSVDPCSGESGWTNPRPQKGSENEVGCSCNDTVCHVTTIFLKTQGLKGMLPRDMSGLPFLQQLDLTRNYLTGPIPPEWGSLRLVNVSLMSNRLSGPIPKEFGNMISLKNITIENNLLSGELPPHLGNLTNLVRLIISSNNFTGQLPETLASLRNMTDFRISDTGLSGKLPSYIGSWTQLQKLMIQGTDLEGPLPPLGSLKYLTDLMISDIKGTGSNFPELSQVSLVRLILRNSNISGEIPDYLGHMENLQIMDLSFNHLSGTVPDSLRNHKLLRNLFLTSNQLSGPVPEWIFKETSMSIDLSVNSFTSATSEAPTGCQQPTVNLVESHSPATKNGNEVCTYWINNFTCASKRKYSSFHIDCGSKSSTVFEGTTFEKDGQANGAATFFVSESGAWAMSSTGAYLDNADVSDDYTVSNSSILSNIPDAKLYTTARHSAISFKYYGLCLWDGPYTVTLYFAEIMFTDDKSFGSLARRIFDVYIQDKLVLKDFNIQGAANGSGKAVTRKFKANVTNGVLRIHFFWAGKGTTVVPVRGDYGPLLSAISVDAGFKPPKPPVNRTIIAIVVAAASAALLIMILLAVLYAHHRRTQEKHKGGPFTLRQIKAATHNFHRDNKIGEGGFGPVYKGRLPDGTVVAIKQLSAKSYQGNREYITEIGLISALQHPNLVKLYGCCTEGDQLFLVYEYLENNSLAHALFRDGIKLDWNTRRKICIGVAKGLMHLHGGTRLKIVHRDIKPTNILLDKDLNAKISDFGMAKLVEDEAYDHGSRMPEAEENSDCNTEHDGDWIGESSTQPDEDGNDRNEIHIGEDGDERSTTLPSQDVNPCNLKTRIVGTEGYIAPEYKRSGHLSCKADVYSFGIVILEIVSGKGHRSMHSEKCLPLLDWAHVLQKDGRLLELVDPELGTDFPREEAYAFLDVALSCTNKSPSQRPDMDTVVGIMDNRTPMKPQSVPSKEKVAVTPEAEIEYSQSHQYSWVRDESQDAPWTASMSTSSMDCTDSGVNPITSYDSRTVDVESGHCRRHPKNLRSKSCENPASWSSCCSCGTKKSP